MNSGLQHLVDSIRQIAALCKLELRSWLHRKFLKAVPLGEITPEIQREIDEAWEVYFAEKARKQEEFEQQPCARCGCSRIDHWKYSDGSCGKCELERIRCDQFLESDEFTPELQQDWRSQIRDLRYSDDHLDELDYYDDLEDERESMEDELRRITREQSCAWDEPYALTYNHEDFGRTQVSMLEGEWRLTFQEWRENKSLPEKAIAEHERKLDEAVRERNSR